MITVAGLTNIEINLKVDAFPVEYNPVQYPCFGVDMSTSGVAFNIAKALKTLGSDVTLLTLGAADAASAVVNKDLASLNLAACHKIDNLKETPQSVNLYDKTGRRSIYCDLKDIQSSSFDLDIADSAIRQSAAAVLCNINFARPMLKVAQENRVPVITDLHVFSNPYDEYDLDFLRATKVLFFSDEGIVGSKKELVLKLAEIYKNIDVIVLGMGADGAMFYERSRGIVAVQQAVKPSKVVNTIGAGDALLSAFAYFYTKGLPASESLSLAQKFASIKIGVSGAANGFVSEEELRANS